jgi:6-phosphogluconate dehydrogenase
MVHNGIEYAEMQILAEVYFFMRYHMNYSLIEIRKVMKGWQESSSASYLLEITIDILNTYDGDTPLLDLVLDQASNKGTGSWALEAAAEIGAPLSTISEALMARFVSGGKHLRIGAAGLYGKNTFVTTEMASDRIQDAYDMVRIINHAIGFELLKMASEKYSWQLSLKEVARIWTNGCIIKSILMEDLSSTALSAGRNLLLNEQFATRVKELHPGLRSFVSTAISVDCPVPVMSAALNYFNQLCTANSSANLIQAQRDYFGAHKFARVDHDPNELFHWSW